MFTQAELQTIIQFCDLATRSQGINVASAALTIAQKAQVALQEQQQSQEGTVIEQEIK